MSQLDDYPLTDLDAVNGETINQVKPGDFVKYGNEPATTFGMLVARFPNRSWTGDVAVVLWSQAPQARVSSREVRQIWEDL